MAIVWMTGCDNSGQGMPYSASANPFGETGCWGNDLFRFSWYAIYHGSPGVTEGGASLYVYNSGADTYEHNMRLTDAGTEIARLYYRTDNTLDFQVTGQTLVEEVGGYTGGWHHYDWTWKIADTGGYVSVYQNKVQLASVTGVDTNHGTNGYVNRIEFNSDLTMKCDDVVIWNTTAGNGWSSVPAIRHRVYVMRPNGDEATETNWTTTGSNHYTEVDEAGGADGDTTALSSSTASQRDRLDVEAYPGISTDTIAAVATEIYAKTDVAGTMKHGVRGPAGSESLSAAITPSTSYSHQTHVAATNPDDAAAWEPSDLASAQIVLENVS